MTNDEIVQELDRMEKDSKALKKQLLQFCWYMRGGLTYHEALMSSVQDQMLIGEIIKDNLETTKKSGLPFF